MQSPTPWTGLDGVISVNDILDNESLQNTIQTKLMDQSYSNLVASGLITPATPATTTPVAAVGQVYDSTGQMVTTTAVTRITEKPTNSAVGTVVGTPTPEITRLGATAEAVAQQGQGSLSSGAVNFSDGQVAGLAAGLGLAALAARTLLTSRVTGDIGALVANASKVGPALTAAWAKGTGLFDKAKSTDFVLLGKDSVARTSVAAQAALKNLAGGAEAQLKTALAGPTGAAMAVLGKASQLATNLGEQIPGIVSRVEKAPAFVNTVDRKTVDAAVTRVIGSPKISSPTYEIPSAANLGTAADIDQAKNILARAGASAQELGNQAVAVVGQAQGAATNLTAQAQGIGPNIFG
jgi:hypothetical protein